MTYGDFMDLVQVLNTGATNPTRIDLITKLVLGKIARRRLPSRVKLATISTSGSSSLNLKTLLPDFFDFKIETNGDRCIYYYESTQPIFLKLVSHGEFKNHTEGGYATLRGKTLEISVPSGATVPATIYFPYYSSYLVLDVDAVTEKETPDDNNDTFLLPTSFDDILVDGVLLYITRREKESDEYTKAVAEWNKSLLEAVFYS